MSQDQCRLRDRLPDLDCGWDPILRQAKHQPGGGPGASLLDELLKERSLGIDTGDDLRDCRIPVTIGLTALKTRTARPLSFPLPVPVLAVAELMRSSLMPG